MVFFKIRPWIAWSKRLESFVKLMSNDSISGLSFSFDADPDPDGKGNFGIFDWCLKFSGKQYC